MLLLTRYSFFENVVLFYILSDLPSPGHSLVKGYQASWMPALEILFKIRQHQFAGQL